MLNRMSEKRRYGWTDLWTGEQWFIHFSISASTSEKLREKHVRVKGKSEMKGEEEDEQEESRTKGPLLFVAIELVSFIKHKFTVSVLISSLYIDYRLANWKGETRKGKILKVSISFYVITKSVLYEI